MRKNDLGRFLKYLACSVLVAGLVLQICMLAAISAKTKQTAAVRDDIVVLSADRDNYNVKLAGCMQRDNIEERAIAMGMQWPTDDQLRVITIPEEYQDTSTHTAEIADMQ